MQKRKTLKNARRRLQQEKERVNPRLNDILAWAHIVRELEKLDKGTDLERKRENGQELALR